MRRFPKLGHICVCCKIERAKSQNDASFALRQLHCDKILKTDWSNATQLMQR